MTDFGERLVGLIAVATLPVGILTGMFVGLDTAAVVFVVGWLLLTPGVAILFDTDSETDDEPVESARASDPIDQLRSRYAAGEIDEVEFERQLETLLETEDVDSTDETAVGETIERLETERE